MLPDIISGGFSESKKAWKNYQKPLIRIQNSNRYTRQWLNKSNNHTRGIVKVQQLDRYTTKHWKMKRQWLSSEMAFQYNHFPVQVLKASKFLINIGTTNFINKVDRNWDCHRISIHVKAKWNDVLWWGTNFGLPHFHPIFGSTGMDSNTKCPLNSLDMKYNHEMMDN